MTISPINGATPRQRRLWELTELRRRIDEEYARIENEIEAERLALEAALARAKEPTCGSDSGYKRHIRHRETTCTACREAHRLAERRRSEARQARAIQLREAS